MSDTANFRVTAIVVASALFMQNLDGTIVATALPSMSRDLHVNVVNMSTAITAYLIALTVFIPVSGWVADRFGAKRVFMSAVAIFTAASGLCALSHGLMGLVAARVLQGLGGAMMVPVGRLLLLRRVRREDLLAATTWLTFPALLGPLLGPPLGGFMTDTLSWRSVFWINLPVGIVGLLLTWRLIPSSEVERPPTPDFFGMVLIGASLTTLMIGTETFGRGLVSGVVPAAMLGIGIALFALTVRRCRRVDNPAIDFSLLSIPTFNAATVAGSLFRTGAGALPFLVPLILQLGFGLSATQSGLIFFANALGSFCMRPMARYALRWFPVRQILIASGIAFALALSSCATFSPAWPVAAIFAFLLLAGIARSLNFAVMGAIAFADVPADKLSAATSFQGTAQQLPKAVGVAIAAVTMQTSMLLAGRSHANHADFAFAFVVVALVVLVSVPMYAALPATAGAGIAGKARQRAHPVVESPGTGNPSIKNDV